MVHSFVEGDTARKLTLTLRDAAGKVLALTGMTVELQWRNAAGQFIEREMEVIDADNGVAEYQFADGEIESPMMSFEWQVTDTSGNAIHSTKLFHRLVREALG